MKIPSASLEGRVALVTGAGQGIGRGIALGLATYGADVAAIDRNARGAEEAAREIEGLGRKALALHADVSDLDAVQKAVARTLETFGAIHILVNNAGGNVGRRDFVETWVEDWDAALRENLMPALFTSRLVAPEMIARGIPGSIVNVSTIEAYRAAPGFAVYAAAKAGVVAFTQSLALELGPAGIRVNGIAPDVTLTPRITLPDDVAAAAARCLPLGRMGEPADYAGTAVYLASDLSGWITGETLHVGGGTHAAGGWLRTTEGTWVNLLPPEPKRS